MRIAVRVRPGAHRERVGGSRDGRGQRALCVAVAASAVDGRANEAVVAALASAFGLRRAQAVIVSGHRGRDKIVDLDGGPDDTGTVSRDRLAELLDD